MAQPIQRCTAQLRAQGGSRVNHRGSARQLKQRLPTIAPAVRRASSATRQHSVVTHCSKTAIVTGANTGLGKVAARELALQGYEVVLACRSLERGEAAAQEVEAACKAAGAAAAVEVLPVDLASLASVADFVSAFKTNHSSCDVLLNNAGVMALPQRTLTEDGFEMQLGVNHLGHFALTAGMLPALLAAPRARVVNVSSVAHTFGTMKLDNLNSDGLFGYGALGWEAYGQSKLANVLFTYELDRQLRAAGVSTVDTNAVHPGVVDTDLPRSLGLTNFYPLLRMFGSGYLITPEVGAKGQLHLATADDLVGVSGKYYSEMANDGKPGVFGFKPSSPDSYKTEIAAGLWEKSLEMTGAEFDFSGSSQNGGVPTGADLVEDSVI